MVVKELNKKTLKEDMVTTLNEAIPASLNEIMTLEFASSAGGFSFDSTTSLDAFAIRTLSATFASSVDISGPVADCAKELTLPESSFTQAATPLGSAIEITMPYSVPQALAFATAKSG